MIPPMPIDMEEAVAPARTYDDVDLVENTFGAKDGQHSRKEAASYLFKFLLLANLLQYLEAGAVPAQLLQLSGAFHMGHGQQGFLGGVVYIALSCGGPCAGFCLRHFEHSHRQVVCISLLTNNFVTFLWALTPVDMYFSKLMFISFRFLMGLTQCIICVYLPLWINEYAPSSQRTMWMSYLQVVLPLVYCLAL